MTVKEYFSFAADFAAVVLMIILLLSLRKLPAEKGSVKRYFRWLSGLVLFMCALHLLKSFADVQLGGFTAADFGRLSEAEEAAWYWTVAAAWFVDILLSTVFVYMWITFLCWFLYEDRDFIRRKFWVGFMPLVISAAVSLVSIPLAVLTEQGFWFFVVCVSVAFVVRVFYFLIGLNLLREYKKQNLYLRFFNPWAFFIPVAVTWLIQDITDWGVASLGTALGMVLLYGSIIREERYLDPETGLYKRSFIGYLKELAGRKQYAPCSAITFTLHSPGEMKEFSGILKKQLPKDCEPIILDDSKLAVLTNVPKRGPLSLVIEEVNAEFKVTADCILKKKSETTVEFMERVL